MPITYYQILSAVLWAVTCMFLVKPTARALFSGVHNSDDEWKSVLFFVALLFVAFPSRRLMMPDDDGAWKVLQALSALLACYVMLLLWNGRSKA